jgi:hypothetical protein
VCKRCVGDNRPRSSDYPKRYPKAILISPQRLVQGECEFMVGLSAKRGRRRWSGLQRRGEGRDEHFRRWRPVAQGSVRPLGVVVAPPALDDYPGLSQRVEDLSIKQFVA